ncbi:MAG: trigger factor [Firmicutes bacterium]|nr:trigger factor [Bacillota bacterium]
MYRWEKIDDNKVCLEIEIPGAEVNEALSQAYRKVVKEIDLPGFRKGKIPRKILESRFGPEIFYEEALEILVNPGYNKAVRECQLEPIDQPQFELVQMEKDKPLIFKVTVDVKPEVELCAYNEITVEHVREEVTPADVENYLQSLRAQHTRLAVVEDGVLQEKDMAIIDFEGKIDGESFEGGQSENHSLEIGSKTFIPGFEEQLLGAGKDEERQITVTFPEDYFREELAGKEAVFDVLVKEIKRPQLPELNDDFVQEITEEFSTLDEFKADVENKLKEVSQQRQKVGLESKIIEKVAEESKVDVPDVLVERELESLLAEFGYYLRMQGLSLEQYGEMVEGGLENLKGEHREEAIKRAKANLVLDAIIKTEGIEASEEEVDQKIAEIAERQESDLDEIKMLFAKQGRLDIIAHEIRYRKAIDLLVEQAHVIEVEADTEKDAAKEGSDEELTVPEKEPALEEQEAQPGDVKDAGNPESEESDLLDEKSTPLQEENND